MYDPSKLNMNALGQILNLDLSGYSILNDKMDDGKIILEDTELDKVHCRCEYVFKKSNNNKITFQKICKQLVYENNIWKEMVCAKKEDLTKSIDQKTARILMIVLGELDESEFVREHVKEIQNLSLQIYES